MRQMNPRMARASARNWPWSESHTSSAPSRTITVFGDGRAAISPGSAPLDLAGGGDNLEAVGQEVSSVPGGLAGQHGINKALFLPPSGRALVYGERYRGGM